MYLSNGEEITLSADVKAFCDSGTVYFAKSDGIVNQVKNPCSITLPYTMLEQKAIKSRTRKSSACICSVYLKDHASNETNLCM